MVFIKLGSPICMVSLVCVGFFLCEFRSSRGQELRRLVVQEAMSSGVQEAKNRPGGVQVVARS